MSTGATVLTVLAIWTGAAIILGPIVGTGIKRHIKTRR